MSRIRSIEMLHKLTFFRSQSFRVRRLVWIVALVALIIWFLYFNARAPCMYQGSSWIEEDPMAFSGFLAAIIGIGYSILIDRNHASLLSRWHNAAILDLEPNSRQEIENCLAQRSLVWQLVVAVFLVACMIISYANFFTDFDVFSEFSLASIICIFMVGLRLGRLVSHGSIGRLIEDHGVPFGITIEHPDRTGGMSEIGTFYLRQAFVVAIPVLWLLVWIFVISYWKQDGYMGWEKHFSYLLVPAPIIFIMTFLIPMRAFRRLIRNWKQTRGTAELDRIRAELMYLRSIQMPTLDQRKRCSDLAHALDSFIRLPDWPISRATYNGFITTLVTTVVLPLITNAVTNAWT